MALHSITTKRREHERQEDGTDVTVETTIREGIGTIRNKTAIQEMMSALEKAGMQLYIETWRDEYGDPCFTLTMIYNGERLQAEAEKFSTDDFWEESQDPLKIEDDGNDAA